MHLTVNQAVIDLRGFKSLTWHQANIIVCAVAVDIM